MGALTSRSAESVCDSLCAFRSLCASSHTIISGRAAAATDASRRRVSYDVTRMGHLSNALLVFAGAPFAQRRYASSAPPPSASAACARTPPSHLLTSAPQLPTSEAGHTSSALAAVGTPCGPCLSIVQMSASDCNDLPSPMSSASKHPARSIATWGDGGVLLSGDTGENPWMARYIQRTPCLWWGRSFLARNGSTTTATPRAPFPKLSASAAVHNTSAPDALGSCRGLSSDSGARGSGTSSGVAGTTSPADGDFPWPTGVAKIAVGDTRFDASPTEAAPPRGGVIIVFASADAAVAGGGLDIAPRPPALRVVSFPRPSISTFSTLVDSSQIYNT